MNTERQQEDLLLFHQQFLHSPIAIRISALLEKHESNIVDAISAKAMDVSGTTDQQLRHYAVQLAETRKIVKTIFDSETFVTKTTKTKQ